MGQINGKLVAGIIATASPPSNPAIGTVWFESSSNVLWFWNGTYWLSVQIFTMDFPVGDEATLTTDVSIGKLPNEWRGGTVFDIYLLDFSAVIWHTGYTSGVDYWKIALKYRTFDVAETTVSVINDDGTEYTNDKMVMFKNTINTHYDLSSTDISVWRMDADKVGSPNGLAAVGAKVSYRLARL